jgi:hypothetical protein
MLVLCLQLQTNMQVKWVSDSDPAKGFEYLFLSDADYQAYRARFPTGSLPFMATRVAHPPNEPDAPAHWKLTDIIGAEDGLGVECLSGSGAIASAFARAFDEGFTITLVSGRTVGIGAYLARLGRRYDDHTHLLCSSVPVASRAMASSSVVVALPQVEASDGRMCNCWRQDVRANKQHRWVQEGDPTSIGFAGAIRNKGCPDRCRVIQRADQPIILTGFQALNKLLGRPIYSSQLQLGGPRIMSTNGFSHFTALDDLDGVKCILHWLSFVPLTVGSTPVVNDMSVRLSGGDTAVRPVTYVPPTNARFNCRHAIAGIAAGAGAGILGLFDSGSWVEFQAGWARTVVTGRARLTGIPVGVLGVETETVMLSLPADPGMPNSAEREIPQAGQARAASARALFAGLP